MNRKRPLARNGFGLILLVALMAISGILMIGTSLFMRNASSLMQLRIDQAKAYYLAQAGVMAAIQDWRDSSSNHTNRTYTEAISTLTLTGNQVFRRGGTVSPMNIIQSNFAYFSNSNSNWITNSGRRRLRAWQIRNIHTNVGGSADNITFQGMRISWTATVGPAPTLRSVRFGGGTFVAAGFYANGSLITPPQATPITLNAGSAWTGNNNYFEWNGNGANVQSISNVRVEWIFSDDVSFGGTENSKSHEVIYWNNGVPQAGAGPNLNTFSITATGDVNQSAGQATRALATVRATVAALASSPPGNIEIIDWDKENRHIL